MAHGLSLELAKIKAPVWRAVDPAALAATRQKKAKRRAFSKKFRNRMWREGQAYVAQAPETYVPLTRQYYMAALWERMNVAV